MWHAEWLLLRDCLRLTGGAAEAAVTLTRGLVVRPERMAANLALTGASSPPNGSPPGSPPSSAGTGSRRC